MASHDGWPCSLTTSCGECIPGSCRMTVFLRRTQKLATALPVSLDAPASSDTALGDWYANRVVVDSKPLLLLVSSRSLLAVLLPARDLRTVPTRLGEIVGARLRRLGVRSAWIHAEMAAMRTVAVAKTADRSVVGIMVDYAFAIPHYLHRGQWDETTLPFVEARLERNPCFAGKAAGQCIIPIDKTTELLATRWGAG